MLEVGALCGRYAATKDPATLAAEFDALDILGAEAPDLDYNVAPTDPVITVVQRHPRDDKGTVDPSRTERTLRVMRWGLVPPWSKDASGAARMINARAESAATKPAYKKSLAERRCIVPAGGWYEWRREGKIKQPFYTAPADGSSLAMAGLWTTWRDESKPDAPLLITCSVLTTDAVGKPAEVHDRMPLVLERDAWEQWLDPDSADVSALLVPPSEDFIATFEMRPVSTAVNSVRNKGPELLAPYEEAQELDELDLFNTAENPR
ncbi:Putative SOS response-associated peptidase YedK [Actinokineospora alba]|uniref:Abasic site processing protein n=1 Tax=Actinokineospora alba TaxID=504798 RepID=A0A1H0UBX2_9PSEU|nr:putative SOS response-associated peptidase YedK [Actinokineospora alba]SDH56451.1 Putative SOS response-associated peptidase YedK [Actinokineospora alba]SDP63802.1 Putative SOS response-associated peptidase YedK [Actinokineospora alba]